MDSGSHTGYARHCTSAPTPIALLSAALILQHFELAHDIDLPDFPDSQLLTVTKAQVSALPPFPQKAW
jgi:hypothetical protein